MSAYIIRLRPWWLRVPLWSAWFPFAAGGVILKALGSYPHRLFVGAFWRTMLAAYFFGIDGKTP